MNQVTQEYKRRMDAYEAETGKKFCQMSRQEWIETTAKVCAMTEREAEQWLLSMEASDY